MAEKKRKWKPYYRPDRVSVGSGNVIEIRTEQDYLDDELAHLMAERRARQAAAASGSATVEPSNNTAPVTTRTYAVRMNRKAVRKKKEEEKAREALPRVLLDDAFQSELPTSQYPFT